MVAMLPALELLQPGTDRTPQPAGALLVSVQVQPRSTLPRSLRLVVYCPHTGKLLKCREGLRQEERCLYLHPRHPKMAWDSR